MCNTLLNIAHLRFSERTNQCDLRFALVVKNEKYGVLREEIKSVRQVTDTVSSLLQHTKNKITKIFEEKKWKDVEGESINLCLMRRTIPIRGNVQCQELFHYKKIKFVIMDETYIVILNAPLILSLTLPKVLYAHTLLRPQIKGMFLDKSKSTITWQKSQDKEKWVKICSDFHCIPKADDIGYYLKLTYNPCNESGIKGDTAEIISEDVVSMLPKLSVQYISNRHQHTKHKLTNNEFRVVSYNILADRYTSDGQFSYVDSKYLSYQYRRQLAIHELLGYNADIICLQEIEFNSYNEFFKGHLKNSGFMTSFFKKGRVLNEGLGFMFDSARFKRIDSKHIVLAKELKDNGLFTDVFAILKRNKDLKEAVMRQHTSLLLMALQCKNTGALLVIANTHLFYHSEAGHIRLIQAVMANKSISKFCKDMKRIVNGNKVAVIFCGDFNSLPESAVYHYMVKEDTAMCTNELERIGCDSKILRNDFDFKSAYGAPAFTNYTDTFKGCLDYIFYQKGMMEVSQVVPLPAEEQMSVNVALPNEYFPSDHIALVADFKL